MNLFINPEELEESRFFARGIAQQLKLEDINSVFCHQGYFRRFIGALLFRIINRDLLDGYWTIDDSVDEIIKTYGVDKKQRDKVLQFYIEMVIEVKRLVGDMLVDGNLYEVQNKQGSSMSEMFYGTGILIVLCLPKETIERFSDVVNMSTVINDLLSENTLCLN